MVNIVNIVNVWSILWQVTGATGGQAGRKGGNQFHSVVSKKTVVNFKLIKSIIKFKKK